MTHQVTDEMRLTVENAAGMGMSHEEIAVLMGVRDPKTIRRRYRKELDQGRAKANLQIATVLFKKCIAGDNTAIIWWEKTRAGKSDRLTLRTDPGAPLQTQEVPPEPELIGKYYERLTQIAADRAARRPAKGVGAAALPEDPDDPGDRES